MQAEAMTAARGSEGGAGNANERRQWKLEVKRERQDKWTRLEDWSNGAL